MMLFPKQLKPLMFAQMRKRGRAARSVFAFLTGVAATLIFHRMQAGGKATSR